MNKLNSKPNLATKNVADFTIHQDGKAFISQRKTAQLTGIPRSTVNRWVADNGTPENLNENNQLDVKLFNKIVKMGRMKGIDKCEVLTDKLVDLGTEVFMHQQAGFTIVSRNDDLEFELTEIDGRSVRSWEEINLALAARIGDDGIIEMRAGLPDSGWLKSYSVPLSGWSVDLERESPLRAFGIQPWQPLVEPVIGQLTPGDAAQAAGIRVGDKVVAVDDQAISDWMALVSVIQSAPGRELEFVIEREGRAQRLVVTPGERLDPEGKSVGFIGAGVQPFEWPEEHLVDLRQGPLDALVSGLDKTVQMVSLTLDSIGKMIVGAISVKNLSGPITIAKVAGASAASGLESFISFLAYLSISLGVLNLLPIPMLDGGHLVYYFVELVRGRPVSEKVQAFGMRIGMALLFSLMALAMLNDIARL